MALSFTEGPGSKVQLIDRPLGSDLDISDVTSDNPQTLSTATLSFKPQAKPSQPGTSNTPNHPPPEKVNPPSEEVDRIIPLGAATEHSPAPTNTPPTAAQPSANRD